MRTIRKHYSLSFGIPMDTTVVKDEAEEDGEDDVGDGSTDNNDVSFLLSLMTKRTALKTRMAAQRTRPLTVSKMDQYMHHHLDSTDVLGPATPNIW